MRNRRPLLLVLALALPGAAHVAAQMADTTSALRGSVLDAESGLPLEGASVTLEPGPAGLLSAGAGGTAGFLSTARVDVTGADGVYVFGSLAPGAYTLRVVRIGYRSASVALQYDGPGNPRVSVGLQVSPLLLEPVEIVARRPEPTAPRTSREPAPEDERLALERLRQARHLTPDTRVVTDADIVEAVTFGETDLLRALHRRPGVTADDDFSAEPWTRGSRWDETRVYFDGLPLYDPLHLGGVSTAVSPDAVGTMTFHSGVAPVDAGAAAAGVVDLRSRSAVGDERVSALAQISMLNARFSVDRPLGRGAGITVSGRRSLIEDVVTAVGADDPSVFPYAFSDLAARWDMVVADSLRLEASGVTTRDRVLGDLPDELKGARAVWGNTAGRATLEATRLGLRTRVTVGAATYLSDVDVVPFDPGRSDLLDATTAAATRNRVESGVSEVTLSPLSRDGLPARWQVGWRRSVTAIEYRGPAPWPYPGSANAGALEHESRVVRAAYWGRLRERLTPSLEASLGLRLEDPHSDAPGELAVAPRFGLAWSAAPPLRLSVAVGRQYQYEQALGTAGFVFGPGLGPGHMWVSAEGGVPALRSDIATVGAELWLPGGWLASASAYARSTHGRLTPPPDSGYVRAEAPLRAAEPEAGWVRAATRAVGLELTARKLVGPWTGSVSYSLQRSRMAAGGRGSDVPGARTHALDASLARRIGTSSSVGGALTAASGAAYTRFYAFRCDEVSWYCPTTDDGTLPPVIGWAEQAGNARTSSYLSLDLHASREGTVLGLPFGVYGQLRNTLRRANRAAYLGSILDCDETQTDCTLTDRFDDGFPLLPLLGLWIRL